jgi:hypothetical protein
VPEPLRSYLKHQSDLNEKMKSGISAKSDAKGFRESNFDLYRNLRDWHVWQTIESVATTLIDIPSDLRSLAEIFHRRQLPEVIRLKAHEAEIAKRSVKLNSKFDDWQLRVLDAAKFSAYSTDAHNSAILVIEGSELSEISEKSPILRVLADKKESSYFLMIDKKIQECSKCVKNE